MKKFIVLLLILPALIHSQNITNTLGSTGIFLIKDATNQYFKVNQSDGSVEIFKNLKIPVTSTGTGIIYKGSSLFLHDFMSPGSTGRNTFLGMNSGNIYISGTGNNGSFNTAVGYSSLQFLSTGYMNSAFGTGSLKNNSTGIGNTAFGYNTLNSNNANSNSAFGTMVLEKNTTGYNNCAFGSGALSDNVDGYNNCAFGLSSLSSGISSQYNCGFGNSTLMDNTGNYNAAFGHFTLRSNTTGEYNSAFGEQSMVNNTTGSYNSALGRFALGRNTLGYANTSIGYNCMEYNTNGAGNTSVGAYSMSQNTSGSLNTVIGYNAGTNIVTGINVTLVGYDSEPTTTSASNQVTLGNNSITSLRCNVTSITSLSDARDKKNIKELSLGLDFITKLRPRQFNWDKREWYDDYLSDGSKMQQLPTAGFIAQELDSLQQTENSEWLNLVLKDNPEKWEATTGNLLPVMVKAIQELSNKCDSLKMENEILNSRLNEVSWLKDKLAALSTEIDNLRSVTNGLKSNDIKTDKIESKIQVISNEETK